MSAVRGVVLPSLLASACSLASLDGFSSGAVTQPSNDDTASGPLPEAGTDAPLPDAPASWCATQAPDALFCADFESRGAEQFGEPAINNGTIGVDTLASRSAPASLFATAGSRRGTVGTFLRKLAAQNVTWAKVSFDLRVEGTHPTAGAELAHLKFTTPSRNYTVGFGVFAGGGGAYAYEYSADPATYEERPIEKAFPMDTWVRITLTADLPMKTVSLEREDEPGKLTAPIAAPLSGPLDLDLELEVGIAYARAGESGWKVRMDNIVLDAN